MTPDYIDTVRLLLAITPTVFASGRFAMKGGTALNLFVQDMPRLSIDIDVFYVDHRPDREGALKTISSELAAMKAALKAKGYRATPPDQHAGRRSQARGRQRREKKSARTRFWLPKRD